MNVNKPPHPRPTPPQSPPQKKRGIRAKKRSKTRSCLLLCSGKMRGPSPQQEWIVHGDMI